MRLLFAISVACFFAVLWVMLAVVREVKRKKVHGSRMPVRQSMREFFEAGEFRTPRPMYLTQRVSRNRTANWLVALDDAAIEQNRHLDAVSELPTKEALPTRPILSYGSDNKSKRAAKRSERSEAVTDNAAALFLARPFELAPVPARASSFASRNAPVAVDVSSARKSPQSINRKSMHRVDLSHYNKDLGDLTDPYTQTLRSSGTQGSPHREI